MSGEPRGTVLVIDDDQDMRWAIRNILAETGIEVAEASVGEGGLDLAGQCAPDAVLLDIQMPGIDGEEVLRRLRHQQKDLPVIMVTAYGTIPGAVEAIRSGAFEYITKPFRNERLLDVVRRAVSRHQAGAKAAPAQVRSAITSVMGHGSAVQLLVDQIETVIATDYSVLIRGETGTGKEVVARCLHEKGPRADHPLVVVDCGSVVNTLIDSEFFGHEKGAYTGAANRRLGWFETAAKGGTLFLDEIGNLSPTGQKALLRALEERVIHRVGSTTPISIDVRVIAATNEALEERIDRAGFREDLFFRLAEYVIVLPPLRARREDIGFLAGRFLDQARDSVARPRIEIAPAALETAAQSRLAGQRARTAQRSASCRAGRHRNRHRRPDCRLYDGTPVARRAAGPLGTRQHGPAWAGPGQGPRGRARCDHRIARTRRRQQGRSRPPTGHRLQDLSDEAEDGGGAREGGSPWPILTGSPRLSLMAKPRAGPRLARSPAARWRSICTP